MITGSQIRAARGALGWSGAELANIGGVSLKTVTNIEAYAGLPEARVSTLKKLKHALEAAGIEFIGTPDDGPGIRVHAKTTKG